MTTATATPGTANGDNGPGTPLGLADRVVIFDTTLRDGEQAPGCSMTQPEKLRVARALAELGVDVIEAGFPAASRGDWEAVNAVAREVREPIICGLARCTREDIELAARALAPAARGRLHVFLATSAIHRQYKLNMAQEQIISRAVEGVKIAREFCDDVEFSPEDASRTELDFLAQVVQAAIEAGATTINIPDTVGYTVPDEFGELFRYLRHHVHGIEHVTLSVHCHDDLGMAVANSLTAVVAGARQIECTINGIGERAGNCSLEEVVMALSTRAGFFNLKSGVTTSRLYPTSRLVSSITGMPIPRNKAVVGENAFAHESGIHQHGMLKHRSTYEIMQPTDVGLPSSNLVLGKHSGRHALRERIKQLGFELDELEFTRVFEEFKALADRKKELFDGDIEALVLRAGGAAQGPWSLEQLDVEVHSGSQAVATVRLHHTDGRSLEREATGDGPVDAAYKAIVQATGVVVTVRKFEVHAVTIGEDAQGEAILYVDYDARSYRGSSVSTNIVEAASRALLEVVNRIELSRQSHARHGGEPSDRTRVAQHAV
ncbi:MAG TPA: 2-isopropylmalate synthase [Steroidobacteraceae bacterium]|jgi:2-isopropylmalate synthase|nr:2-isopropylmalate synthase [Steroidobacteraceae bacterium]